jgi:hypothetical protein
MRRHWRTFLLLTLLASVVLPPGAAAAAAGGELWLHVYEPGYGAIVRGAQLAVTGTGGDVYVAGTRSDTSDAGDFVVARYDADGVRQWAKTYDKDGTETLADIGVDSAGNVVACGTQGEDKALLTVKYSRAGKLLWARRLTLPGGRIQASEMAVTTGGAIYIGGMSKATVLRRPALRLVKYTSGGFLAWQRSYTTVRGATQLALGPSERIYLAGERLMTDRTTQVGVVCYEKSGERLWSRSVGHAGRNDAVTELRSKRNGLCGVGQYSADQGYEEGLIFRMSLDGTTRYVTSIPTPNDEGAKCYSCDMDGIGRVTAGGAFYEGFTIWRFGSTGTLGDTYEADKLGDALAIAVTTMGDVYATGGLDPTNSAYDFNVWTIGRSSTWLPLFSPFSHGSPTQGQDSATQLVLASGCFYEAGISDDDLLIAKYER